MPDERPGRSMIAPAAVAVGAALATGAIVGLAMRAVAPDALAEERGSAAGLCALALAVCVAPSLRGRRVERMLLAVLSGAAVAAAAVATTGGADAPGIFGAAAVTAGAAALCTGTALLAGRSLCLARGAGLVGALVPFALAALVFVADPWIEPRGSGPESPARASLVYRLSPVAALTSLDGGTGVDWQTRSLLYDGGPDGGAGGLSVIGQYYPSRPSSPLVWGGAAALLGALLAAAGSSRPRAPDTL